ncbi:MAG TPA: hypothetical protein HA306_01135 [Methanosarcina sp.]|nr:hypothetical protein [Methanosarcina sp.]
MVAYNWIIILLTMGIFGLLYASTYDVVATAHDNYAYTGDPIAALGVKIFWLAWKYLPVICLFSLFVYGVMSAQKNSDGGWK